MAQNSLPSFNPANATTPAGIMSEVLKNFARNFECCIPAIVQSYDRTTHEAVVQPAMNIVTTLGESIERASVSASVWRFMCGGYLIDLPISEGDTGWLIAADRDTSTFKETLTTSKPNTNETHRYSAGFFIPDNIGSMSIDSEDSDNMVFQNSDGTEKISIGESSTKITSAALTIDCPSVILTGDAVISGSSYLTHTHSGVTIGTGETGTIVS